MHVNWLNFELLGLHTFGQFYLTVKLEAYHLGHRFNKKKWWIWSGARLSYHCDTLVSGPSLTFRNSGERVLTTRDLDLSTAR